VKEVTLLGQIVNLYGRHEFPAVDGKSPFVQLLEAVHEVPGIQRIRFTSPHPIGYKKDLIEAFTYLPKLAEHVHLPVQSGSDAILKRMHRPYTAAKFTELVQRIRAARPDIAVTTDVIVGFPGETRSTIWRRGSSLKTSVSTTPSCFATPNVAAHPLRRWKRPRKCLSASKRSEIRICCRW
jgi:tRNA A37 methylthiotransferase MiaB